MSEAMLHPAPLRLDGSERATDEAWPGVVARLGEGWRVIVVADGSAYRLQQLGADEDGLPHWCTVGGSSRPALLVERFGARVPGLANLFARLPADPADAAPALVAARAVLVRDLERTRMTSPRYGRVIRQDSQIRLVVDPAGQRYAVQWAPIAEVEADAVETWKTLRADAALSVVADTLLERCYDPAEGPKGRGGDRHALAERVAALVEGCPAMARDGVWQELPHVVRVER